MIHMDLADAIQIVLDLARQNIIDIKYDADAHAAQKYACDILEDFAVNQLGDD